MNTIRQILARGMTRLGKMFSFFRVYLSTVHPTKEGLRSFWGEHRQQIITAGWYSAYGFVLFLFFAYLTFPFQEIRGRVETYLGHTLSSDVEIGTIEPSLLPGLVVKDITVSDDQGDSGSILTIDTLTLRIGILPLLWLTHRWSAEASLYGGKVRAIVKERSHALDLNMKIGGVKIEDIRYVEKRWGLKLRGKLSGEFRLNGAPNNSSLLKGKASVRLDDGGIDESSVLGVFKIPSVTFDDAHGNMVISSGKGVLEELRVTGKGVELLLTGDVIFQNNVGQSTIDIKGKFKVSEPVTSALNSILPYINLQKDAQGYNLFSITGTLSAPWPRN